ncbi:MAG: signal peptide peptidase SppA [Desulfuromonadales bacterium]|nr:signal peptide peptidase SppA [Desulfuromonadales bacterium]
MSNRPFLIALSILGGIFLLFFALILLVSRMTGGGSAFSFGEKVGVVEITGVITSSREAIENLHRFRDDNGIKAIVLRVDSPGGGVGPSQEIYQEVKKIAAIKPVVASMGAVAASGGYYVAAPAQQIVANPGTITGSIGVIMEFTNIQELLGKIGLHTTVVKSGDHKDIGSPFRPLSPADRALLQGLIDDVHRQFITDVSEGRNLDLETVRALADGRIFTGQQALDAGLIDSLGNLPTAIEVAAELGGIEGTPQVVYPPKSKGRILDYLITETVSQLQRGLQERSFGLQFLWSGVE